MATLLWSCTDFGRNTCISFGRNWAQHHYHDGLEPGSGQATFLQDQSNWNEPTCSVWLVFGVKMHIAVGFGKPNHQ